MKTIPKTPGKMAKILGFLGLGLCVLCCALPIIGIVGGASFLTAVALYAEKIAMVLLILSGTAFGIWFYRKRQAPPTCSVDCSCKRENAEPESLIELKTK